MRHFLLRKLGPLSIALLALGMFARTTQTTLVASVGDALEFTSLCRPTRTAAIALPPIAVLAELHLTVAVRTVEEAIGRSEERRVGKECRSRWRAEHDR